MEDEYKQANARELPSGQLLQCVVKHVNNYNPDKCVHIKLVDQQSPLFKSRRINTSPLLQAFARLVIAISTVYTESAALIKSTASATSAVFAASTIPLTYTTSTFSSLMILKNTGYGNDAVHVLDDGIRFQYCETEHFGRLVMFLKDKVQHITFEKSNITEKHLDMRGSSMNEVRQVVANHANGINKGGSLVIRLNNRSTDYIFDLIYGQHRERSTRCETPSITGPKVFHNAKDCNSVVRVVGTPFEVLEANDFNMDYFEQDDHCVAIISRNKDVLHLYIKIK